jgi:hypothetical protein
MEPMTGRWMDSARFALAACQRWLFSWLKRTFSGNHAAIGTALASTASTPAKLGARVSSEPEAEHCPRYSSWSNRLTGPGLLQRVYVNAERNRRWTLGPTSDADRPGPTCAATMLLLAGGGLTPISASTRFHLAPSYGIFQRTKGKLLSETAPRLAEYGTGVTDSPSAAAG